VELNLSSDQKIFAETTRDFLSDTCPTSALREKRDDPDGFDRGFWQQGAEFGWTSLLVDEKDGGGSISGRGVNDLTLLAFEFGRFAAPGPLASANVVAGAIARSGSDEQKSGLLAELIAGEKIGTWAYGEPRPNDAFGTVTLQATRSGDGYVLSGRKLPVEAAGQADVLLVTARDGEGLSQFVVPTDAAGVSVKPMKTVDLTRRFGAVSFDGVQVPASAVVGEPGQAAAEVERQIQIANVITLSEMLGSWDRALEITLEWLFNRYSFGRPLASYQVLKHRFVDSRAWLEAGNAVTDAAASYVEEGSPRAAEYVSAAKSVVGYYGPEGVQECVQMHGGIGVTFEHDLHLFLRRVVLGAASYGTVEDHRERLTSILENAEQQELKND
jgi:alkylation response protein AidB-like acyl-CoA dehydrogenase